MNRDERIVVVGGGLTGLRAAERLRELKFEGDITILGDEKLPPYHRPALSKQLLQGSLRASDLTLPAYEDLNARWRFGTQVRQLIPNKKTLVLPGGEEMTYDGLIIATGVEATRQNGVPYHDPRVLVLRTMSDGLDLERVIGSTKGRVAVVGGGFTGCELAASLRHLSREVTLIGRGKNLLGNVLGPDLGEWLTNMHRDHGVDLALGNSVEEWAPGPDGIALRLTDGSRLTVSCVILAAGTKPMTHWLRGSGLPLDNGVVCEPTCHVVGAEDVVAAGDVAQWPNLRFDNVPRRVEHWLNAVEMGRAAAESLLAGRQNAEPFCPMPRFWTDQYSARIQAAGMLKLGKDIVKLGTPDEGTGTVYGFSSEGRLMGVVGVDCPGAMIAWAESVGRQNPEPRPRVVAGSVERPAIAAAASAATSTGFAKKPKGKHSAPPQGKQFQKEERKEHEFGVVEHPAEVSGPIGVGAGRVPGGVGRPQSVVDSFSRMLPVAVRPQPPVGPPPGSRPIGGRTLPVVPAAFGGTPAGPLNRGATGGPRGPINAPFGDGASTSGAFRSMTGPSSTGFNGPVNGVPQRRAIGPATGHQPPVPEFSAAEMTDVGGNMPEPLAGRVGPDSGLAIDVTGQMALLDANGHVRTPDFSDLPPRGPSESHRALPPVGPESSFSSMPPVRRGTNGSPVARGPQDSFRALPPARGPQDSVGGMPPVRRGAQDSFGSLPAVRRAEASSNGMPPARGPEESFSSMPPVRRGTNGKPVAAGPQDSFRALPPARGPQDSFGSMPAVGRANGSPVARGPQASAASMPAVSRTNGKPVARGPQDSFGGMPPVRRGAQDSFSALPPARGPEDSHDSMPAVSRTNGTSLARGPQDSFSSLPPARRAETSAHRMPPVRGPERSSAGMPPARPAGGARRTNGAGLAPPPPPVPPALGTAETATGAIPPVRSGGRRHKEDMVLDTIVDMGDRHASHRAEDLTPEFGRPPKRRNAEPDLSNLRLVPALSSMDDSIEMPAVRMPKHGRPEDYGVPVARGGPEDSYDQIPAVERPRSSGGRRRARA